MVGWLEKISDIMVCWQQKLKTDKNPLKQSQKNEICPRKEIMQNLEFGVIYLLISDFLVDSQNQKN